MARYRRDPTLRIFPVALPGISQKDAGKLGAGNLFQEVNWADFTKGPDDKESLDKLEAALTGRKVLDRGPAFLTPYQVRRDGNVQSERPEHPLRWSAISRRNKTAAGQPDAIVATDVVAFFAASRERQNSFWRRTAIGAGITVALLLAAFTITIICYVPAEQRRLSSVSRRLAMAARDAAGAIAGY